MSAWAISTCEARTARKARAEPCVPFATAGEVHHRFSRAEEWLALERRHLHLGFRREAFRGEPPITARCSLSTSPLDPVTSWGNRVFRLDRELAAGDSLCIDVDLGVLVEPSTWQVRLR